MNTTTTLRASLRPRAISALTVIKPKDNKLGARCELEAIDHTFDLLRILLKVLGNCNFASLLHVDLCCALASALGNTGPGPWPRVVDHCKVWLGCDSSTCEGIDKGIGCLDLGGPTCLARLRGSIHDQNNVKSLIALHHFG